MFKRPRYALGGLATTVTLLVAASPGAAQQRAPLALAPGKAITGVCVFDQPLALDQSQAGISAAQQISQMAQGIRGELAAQRNAIVADDRALAQQKPSLQPAVFQQRVTQLRERYAALDRTGQLRDAQLGLTKRDAVNQMMRYLSPALAEIITARGCALVVDRAAAFAANPAMDITPQIVTQMNAKVSGMSLRLAPPEAVQRPR